MPFLNLINNKTQREAAFSYRGVTKENVGLTDTVNRASHVYTDGNIYGTLWGGWLNNWLNGQFTARDNNIGTRATWDWVKQNFVQNIDLTAPQTIQFWDGKGYPRGTDGAAMYNFMMVGGASNVGWFQVRYTRKLINGIWNIIN
ncbi:hypothetical protein PJO24_002187 [Salmonella enterica]|nr:hypothetical protein [Salmonella enterica]